MVNIRGQSDNSDIKMNLAEENITKYPLNAIEFALQAVELEMISFLTMKNDYIDRPNFRGGDWTHNLLTLLDKIKNHIDNIDFDKLFQKISSLEDLDLYDSNGALVNVCESAESSKIRYNTNHEANPQLAAAKVDLAKDIVSHLRNIE